MIISDLQFLPELRGGFFLFFFLINSFKLNNGSRQINMEVVMQKDPKANSPQPYRQLVSSLWVSKPQHGTRNTSSVSFPAHSCAAEPRDWRLTATDSSMCPGRNVSAWQAIKKEHQTSSLYHRQCLDCSWASLGSPSWRSHTHHVMSQIHSKLRPWFCTFFF